MNTCGKREPTDFIHLFKMSSTSFSGCYRKRKSPCKVDHVVRHNSPPLHPATPPVYTKQTAFNIATSFYFFFLLTVNSLGKQKRSGVLGTWGRRRKKEYRGQMPKRCFISVYVSVPPLFQCLFFAPTSPFSQRRPSMGWSEDYRFSP